MKTHQIDTGWVIEGDVTDPAVAAAVVDLAGDVPLVVADPPYGRIVSAHWDRASNERSFVDWMIRWTAMWARTLVDRGAFYVWGGVGKVGFRPFFRYMADVEEATGLQIANPITWAKKRGYGVQNNYLFAREELAYMIKGDAKKPRTFHVPLLDRKRGYAGYNKNYPAKSEFFRRTTVWNETEILRGKLHECQKADRVCEVPIEVHTEPGETVIELFGGSGSVSAAAQRLGRRFVVVESDPTCVELIRSRLEQARGANKVSSIGPVPDDYEACGDCGFDHGYEQERAAHWHRQRGIM